MHLVIKTFPCELVLRKEAKKPMDLTIPMGQREPSKESIGIVKWHKELYTQAKKNSWNRFKNGMRSMPIEHEGTWSLKLGNMCG
jgi:hypothetical protein